MTASRGIDAIPVVGGSLHGRRVRWQGPRLYAPAPIEIPIRVSDSPPPPAFPEVEIYEAWKAEDGSQCYIEEGLARQIEADRKRHEIRMALESLLDDVMPDPAKLTMPCMEGYVWWCGDEWCDCYRAEIVGWEHTEDGWRRGYRGLWSGSFHTDGEDEVPHAELRACRDWLRLVAPSTAAQIKWHDID